MKKPTTVKALEELGRVRLSPSFFMRDFLHSEIANLHGMPNVPDDPDLAIGWHERPQRRIDSYIAPKGTLTKSGMANHAGQHDSDYAPLMKVTATVGQLLP